MLPGYYSVSYKIYNDYFYFSKVFKKHCSYSPKEYRRQFYNIKESDS